jgi:hypothetical protein
MIFWLGLGEWNTRMSKFEQYRRNAEEAQRRAALRATKSGRRVRTIVLPSRIKRIAGEVAGAAPMKTADGADALGII